MVSNYSILKVLLIDSEERIEEARLLLEVRACDLPAVPNIKNVLEFTGYEASKGQGLASLLEHLDIESHELAAFGDAPNDISMFQIAGYSCAMNTGWEEAKACAYAVSPEGLQGTAFARAVGGLKERAQG